MEAGEERAERNARGGGRGGEWEKRGTASKEEELVWSVGKGHERSGGVGGREGERER